MCPVLFRRMTLLIRHGCQQCHIKCLLILFLSVFLLDIYGIFIRLREEDYFSNFRYPLEGDILLYIQQIKTGKVPDVRPINYYSYNFSKNCVKKCRRFDGEFSEVYLVYVVKSAMDHFENRNAIRRTWGRETPSSYKSKSENDFLNEPIKRVFILGVTPDRPDLQIKVDEEAKLNRDIVQADFIDAYLNTTIKTMMGFRWVVNYCPNTKYVMFSDDDMYVSTKNVISFIRDPLKCTETTLRTQESKNGPHLRWRDHESDVNTINNDNDVFFAGRVNFVAPVRQKFSKWFISLAQYPFTMYPPFIPAGAYVVSIKALLDMYYTSFYTKHFPFDDVYLGLLSKKAGIQLHNCDQFYYHKKKYKFAEYQNVIASHGYENPEELLTVWDKQRNGG